MILLPFEPPPGYVLEIVRPFEAYNASFGLSNRLLPGVAFVVHYN